MSRWRWASGYRLQSRVALIILELLEPEDESTSKLLESITQRLVISDNTWVFGNRATRNSNFAEAFLLSHIRIPTKPLYTFLISENTLLTFLCYIVL